jgi:hypothetical protein
MHRAIKADDMHVNPNHCMENGDKHETYLDQQLRMIILNNITQQNLRPIDARLEVYLKRERKIPVISISS